MTKDIIECIEERQSTRKFKLQPVPEPTIGRLVEAAIKAPSAGNRQPWKLIVVLRDETKQALAGASHNRRYIADAGACIVFCLERGTIKSSFGRRGEEVYSQQDLGAAIENLLLAATGYGLGTCWVGDFDRDKVAQILELGGDLRPEAIIAVGYSDGDPELSPRRNTNEVVRVIQ